MNVRLFVPALLAAVGVGLLAHVILNTVVALFRLGLQRRRRSLALLAMSRSVSEPPSPSEEELYGLPRNLIPQMALAALAGLATSWALLDGPTRGIGLIAGILPLFWKRRRLAQARQEVRREVAHLIEELRLHLAFGGSLGAALGMLAQGQGEEPPKGLVHTRLHALRDLITVSGPEAVLERLATELRSAELWLLLRRIGAARRGGTAYSDALRASADEALAEINRQAWMEVEGAPLRLMFPMLVLLLPPILALALYPPAYALIAALSGAGPEVLP